MEVRHKDQSEASSWPDFSRWNLVSISSLVASASMSSQFSACVSGIFRIYYTHVSQTDPDVAYNYKGVVAWASSLEKGSGIVIASLPIMPRLVKWLRDEKLTITGSSRSFGSFNSTKLRRLKPASNDPHSLIHAPASIAGRSLNLQEPWIPLEDEQPKSLRADERHSIPISDM